MKGIFKNRGNSVKENHPTRHRRSLSSLFGNTATLKRNSAESRTSSREYLGESDRSRRESDVNMLDIGERVYQQGALPVNIFHLATLQPKAQGGEFDANATCATRENVTSLKLMTNPSYTEEQVLEGEREDSPVEPGDSDDENGEDIVADDPAKFRDATKRDVSIDLNDTTSGNNYINVPSEFFSYNTKFINHILDYCSGDIISLCRVSMLNMIWMEQANDDSRWKPHFDELLSKGRKSTIGLDEHLSYKTKYATMRKQSKLSGKKASKIASFARSRKQTESAEIVHNAPGASSSSSIVSQKEEEEEEETKAIESPPASPPITIKEPKSAPSPPPLPSIEMKPKPSLSRMGSQVKPLTPTDPTPYYSMDVMSIEYREDGDKCVKWSEDGSNGKTVVEAATLNKLIELLTSPEYFDQHFLHTFIITYRSLMDRETLINKLIERYNIPPPDGLDPLKFAEFKRNKLDKIRLRVTNTVKYWLENFYVFDFDEEMIKHYERLVTMMEKSKGEALAKMLRNSMEKANEKATADNVTAGKLDCPPVMYPKKSLFGKAKSKDNIMNWPVVEVARQITLIDFGLFSKIDPKECLNQSWNKEHRTEKAPNISNFIEQFNHLSKWIGTEVVKMEDLEKRVKLMCKFIDVAEVCKDLNNFNGLFSVLSGLKLSGVYRLKETWKNVPEEYKQKYDTLSEYMKNDSNFKIVRSAIKAVKPPCIPYIGLYLTDLTFIEDGMPKYDDDDKARINFEKCSKFAEVIRDMQTYQNQRYALMEVPEVQDILLHTEIMTEEEMFKQSLKIEARKKKKKKQTVKAKTDSS